MTPERIQIKLFRHSETDLKELIPTFHEWIRDETVDGLLIDVADYRHVPNGPGLLLMGHDGDYSVANDNGRTAIVYKHKRDWPSAELADRVNFALDRALNVASKLESDPINQIEISFPDRLNTPNTAETFEALAPTISTVASQALNTPIQFTHGSTDPRHMFALLSQPNQEIVPQAKI